MFGYVTIAGGGLPQEARDRYRAYYCGLCHTLQRRHGALSRLTLSFDATFLYLLLTSLYEPQSTEGAARCLPHPAKAHAYILNEFGDYCCDMNLALAYHKCMDDWQDDHSLTGRAEAALLETAYRRVQALYPAQCAAIELSLAKLSALEKDGQLTPDAGANLSADMLGAVYHCRSDLWTDALVQVGQGLGRFVYLMDAYDDLEADMRKGRCNPLRELSSRSDYEELIKETLTMMLAEATDAFETLPLVKDMDILRNILYAGCWSRYELHKQKRERKSGMPAERRQSTADQAAEHKEDGV